jgi:hypothetical protein
MEVAMDGRKSPLGAWVFAVAGLVGSTALAAADCNRNGVEDADDVVAHGFGFEPGGSYAYEDPAVFLVTADLSGDGAADIVAPSVYSERLHQPWRRHVRGARLLSGGHRRQCRGA